MKNLANIASRVVGTVAMVVALGWLQPADVAAQTAENTVITNRATVTYTDANTNSYSSVFDEVDVTVGFLDGVDVVASQATATPVSPSSNNTMDFDLDNIGNGTDSMSVGEFISDGTVLSVVKYTLNAFDYFTLGDLNDALADTAIAAAGTAAITVTYDIATGKGGEPSIYRLTGTSRRGSATDNDSTIVTPALTGSVATTPDGSQSLTHLPSNGTNYTFTFTVTNLQTGADDFDLLVTSPGSAVISIVSVDGFAGDSTRVNIAALDNPTFDVIYSVADVAAGVPDTLYLQARSVTTPATEDSGFADMTVVKASLAVTKEAYRDNKLTLLTGPDRVLPGEFIQYKVTITNNGTAPASSVQVIDILDTDLTYDSATEDAPTWTFSPVGNTLTSDLTGTLAGGGASRFFWIRVQVN